MKEAEIQKQILEYLTIKNIFHYRNNSGAMQSTNRFGKSRFMRFGAVGSPDIICVINGTYIGIEVKAPKGKQSEHQKNFQASLERAGGKYILAFDLDDVIKLI